MPYDVRNDVRREAQALDHDPVKEKRRLEEASVNANDVRWKEEEEYREFLKREVGDLNDLVSIDGDAEDDDEGGDEKAGEGVEGKASEKESPKKKGKKKSLDHSADRR